MPPRTPLQRIEPPRLPPPTPPIEIVGTHGVGPLMLTALPPMASGADVYARQFYRGSRVPYRRYLPISLE
jgi:hypothetical protein